MSSFHENAPASFTNDAPMWFFAVHSMNTAPAGSATTAMRPASMTSNGGAMTLPPADSTSATVPSRSLTVMYEFQCGGMPSGPGGMPVIAATSRPRNLAIEYAGPSG